MCCINIIFKIAGLAWVSMRVILAEGILNPTTPPVLVVSTQKPPNHNNSFGNYFTNFTYPVTLEQREILRLECLSDQPNQWDWTGDIYNIFPQISIEKERKQVNESHYTFSSILEINLGSKNFPVGTNFSCSLANSDASGYVTCVELMYSADKLNFVRIFDGISAQKCLHGTIWTFPPISTGKPSPNTTSILTVDLPGMKAKCNFERHRIGRTRCADLDSCETLVSPNVTRCCFGKVEPYFDEGFDQYIPYMKVQNRPLLIYCTQHLDSYVPLASVTLYPSVRKDNLQEFSYYKSLDAARHENSVQIFAHSLDKKYNGTAGYIGTEGRRTEFADGERVLFMCAAVRYLYMRGVQWRIGHHILPDSPQEEDVLNASVITNSDLYIMGRHLILNQSLYGRFFNISCLVPIWNSIHQKIATADVYLSRPVKPSAKLSCRGFNDGVSCKCEYNGWPKPTISIDAPNFQINLLDEEATHDSEPQLLHSHRRMFRFGFEAIRLVNSRVKTSTITCVSTNFHGMSNDTYVLDDTEESTMTPDHLIIGISVTACLIIIVAGILITFIYSRSQRTLRVLAEKQCLTEKEIEEFKKGQSSPIVASNIYERANQVPYKSEYEISKQELGLNGTVLGSGEFGLVLRGKIRGRLVAVKTVKENAGVIQLRSLITELKVLQYVGHHKYIVNLVAANTNNIGRGELFLAMDFCSNGSLDKFLRGVKHDMFTDLFPKMSSSANQNAGCKRMDTDLIQQTKLSSRDLIRFSHEIAIAMDYLHSKQITHGDLAARNVLLTHQLHTKLCDFGMSKHLINYDIYVLKTSCPLPVRWMAPECLQDLTFSLESDKWSYGVLLWEIFSLGEQPYTGEAWSFDSYRRLQAGYRMLKPEYSNDQIYNIMLECWNNEPKERPSFKVMCLQLRSEQNKLLQYPVTQNFNKVLK